MGLDRPIAAPETAEGVIDNVRDGPGRRAARRPGAYVPPFAEFPDSAGRGQVMTAARRHSSKLPLLTALLALLALCGAFLWSPGSPWPTPAEAQNTPRILVSNLDQGDGNAETTNGNDHAQLFHTGNATTGYLLTSVIVNSQDPQGDDFDVEVCLANNDTGFPTSTCTELNPPGSFPSGDLTFTAPGDGMRLQRNDNYSVVIKQKGTGSVILNSTTSGGEDSTGLSDWSIKNKFDWKDGGTWKQAGSDEAIRIEINGHEAVNRAATGRPVVLVSAEGPGILAADTWRIADADGLPYTDFKGSVDPPGSGDPTTGEFVFDFSYQWVRVDAGHRGRDQRGRRLAQVPAGRRRFRQADQGAGLLHGPVQQRRVCDQRALRPHRQAAPPAVAVDAGGQHRPVAVGRGDDHQHVRHGLQAGDPRPGLRDLQRRHRPGRGAVEPERLPVDRGPSRERLRGDAYSKAVRV